MKPTFLQRLFSKRMRRLCGLKTAGVELYLLTARQAPAVVSSEIALYGIDGMFREVVVTGPVRNKGRVITHLAPFCRNDVFVGDTGKDVELGKSLGCLTVAVANGFVSKERLREYSPDIVVEKVTDIAACAFTGHEEPEVYS